MKRPVLIVLAGPTAIGKTRAAIALAQHLETEIISADSRQFYKEMHIGTAKPTLDEQRQVPHHFVDFLSIEEEYTSGDFERDAIALLEEHFQENDTMVMTGGSGLFIKAVTHGFDPLPSSPEIRNKWIQTLEEKGIETLQARLKALDPAHYEAMDIHNPQRLIRALEVCEASGKPYSAQRKQEGKKRIFDTIYVGLNADREIIYNRINARVDMMIDEGLIEEAKHLHKFKDLNALNTVGYRELFPYFEGAISQEEAIENIKKNTRNFAKRQLTWFKKNTEIQWFDHKEVTALIKSVDEQIQQKRGL